MKQVELTQLMARLNKGSSPIATSTRAHFISVTSPTDVRVLWERLVLYGGVYCCLRVYLIESHWFCLTVWDCRGRGGPGTVWSNMGESGVVSEFVVLVGNFWFRLGMTLMSGRVGVTVRGGCP